MLKLEELDVYNLAMEGGSDVWLITKSWDNKSYSTVGNQIVRAADSIAANIAEGYGRYFYKENKQLCYYARGSLMETKTFFIKAMRRYLISTELYQKNIEKLSILHKKLNAYIKRIGKDNIRQPMTNDQ